MSDRQLDLTMLSRHADELVLVKLPPEKIDYFNKIIEGYDNLAMVSTVDAKAALLVCWVTADMRPVLLKLLDKIRGVKLQILDELPPEYLQK